MKKNRCCDDVKSLFYQILRKMKLTLLLLFLTVLTGIAADSYSQSTKLTLKLENVRIEDLLNKIEDQSQFRFFYNEEINLEKKISIDVSTENISIILEKIFADKSIHYEIIGRQIILSNRIGSNNISSQQPKSISGKVTDSSGGSLPGVSVVVKGTTTGVITDMDGKYTLSKVPENATLQFSFVGMKTQEIKVGTQSSINVVLAEETVGIEEVVAIGYGTKSKETLTGAISVIDDKVLEGRPAIKTTDLLQGISSGVQITRGNTGNIRSSANTISIRGLTSRNSPGVLVVIDGIAQASTDATALDNLNPDDIENISVLKDGQAAIYGARAAGGVILVTTKKGKTDKPTINFSYNYTIQKPSLMQDHSNILQMVEMHNEGFVNDGQTSNAYTPVVDYIASNRITLSEVKKNNGEHILTAPFGIAWALGYYDWNDIMFDPSPLHDSNLSISGKSNKLNYYGSVSYQDQEGMLAYGSNYKKRLLITLKNDYTVTDFLKIKTNFRIGNQKVVEPYGYGSGTGSNSNNTGVQGSLKFNWPSQAPYTKGGHYYNMGGFQDPIGYAKDAGNTTDLSYIIDGNLGMEITPVKDVSITAEVASNYNITETDWANIGFKMYDLYDNFNAYSNNGINSAGASYARDRYTTASIYAKYDFTKIENHKLNLMAGYSHEEDDYRYFSAYRSYGLISAELPTMGLGSTKYQYNDESKTDYAINSLFSRLEYSFRDRYLFEGVFRYDGSSKFADGYKWAPFYGFSGGWVISNESFMANLKKVIDFMKIRGSWGQLGNQASIGLYDYLSQISIGGSYPMGSWTSPAQTQSAYLGSMPSTTRTWEKIESTDVGIDLRAFNSKLTGSLDVYVKNNKNMFFTKEYPSILGTTAPSINGAHVRTKGWEVEIGWRDKINQLGYSVKMNLSNYNSDVIELADAVTPFQGTNSFVQGNPINSYFGYRYDGFIQTESELAEYKSRFTSGIPNNLKVGDARFKDLDGDGKLEALSYTVDKNGKPTSTSGDLVRIGDGNQHYLFGISLGFNWKNIDFSSFFQGVLKWDVITTVSPITAFYEPIDEYFYHKTWSEERKNAIYPRLSQDASVINYNYQYSNAPYKMYNNRYIRLKNIQLGYTLPGRITNKVKLDKVRVYFSGIDIWESSNLPGSQDPETPFYQFSSPFPRQYSFGVNVTF